MTYNKNAVYWIFLQSVIGAGSRKLLPIINRFGSAQAFAECRFEDIKESGLLSRAELNRFSKLTLDDCREIMSLCNSLGYQIITPNDKKYPKRLAQIPDPPAVLYVLGDMPDFDSEVCIAMVGTRKCSDQGKSIARELAARLTAAGAIIISGGAVGIDSSSHIGALRANGKTYAVLGCGLNYPYLAVNAELRDEISKNGALISEYQPNTPAGKYTFPVRNRIISGLCLGTIVVEATHSSGSLITVDHALEQGRDIFVIPGEIANPLYAGSNRLIRDGAIAVTTPYDVLSEYNNYYPHKLNLNGSKDSISCIDPPQVDNIDDVVTVDRDEEYGKPVFKPKKKIKTSKSEKNNEKPSLVIDTSGLSENAKVLLDEFKKSDSQYFDIITANSNISASDAIAALTELEIMGVVSAQPGGRYILNIGG